MKIKITTELLEYYGACCIDDFIQLVPSGCIEFEWSTSKQIKMLAGTDALSRLFKEHFYWLRYMGILPLWAMNDLYLEQTDLSGADLRCVDLHGSNLSNANLSDANLSDSNLTKVNLIGANLQGAKLRVTNLSSAVLTGADLTGADLTRANLKLTDLTGVKLKGENHD